MVEGETREEGEADRNTSTSTYTACCDAAKMKCSFIPYAIDKIRYPHQGGLHIKRETKRCYSTSASKETVNCCQYVSREVLS